MTFMATTFNSGEAEGFLVFDDFVMVSSNFLLHEKCQSDDHHLLALCVCSVTFETLDG